MKKIIYTLSLLSTVGLMASCSHDDDNYIPGEELAENVYAGSTLTLTYSGEEVFGKKVEFQPSGDAQANIIISGCDFDLSELVDGLTDDLGNTRIQTCGVIPGSVRTSIEVELKGDEDYCYFNGQSNNDYCTFTYSGVVTADKMTLEIKNVELDDHSISGTWTLPEFNNDIYNVTRLVWESSKQVDILPGFPLPINSILGMMVAMPVVDNMNIPQWLDKNLNTITLGKDGNITVNYLDENGNFVESPKNIAQYILVGGKMYVFLNPQGIIAARNNEATRSEEVDSVIDQLIGQLLPMSTNGIPVSYGPVVDSEGNVVEGSSLSLYLDDETLLPLMRTIAPLLRDKDFVTSLVSFAENDPNFSAMAPFIPGICSSFFDIIGSTTRIEIGVNFIR